MDNKRPAPLSADSLRELKNQIFDRVRDAQSGIDDDDIKLSLARLATKEIMQLHAAALQAERQRIAVSLPPRIDEDAPMIGYKGDEEGRKLLKAWRRGRNETLEAVRAVLIPPMGELGDSKTSEEANSSA